MSPSARARNDFATEAMGFHTTHWTVVLGARSGNGPAADEALARVESASGKTKLFIMCRSFIPFYFAIKKSTLGLQPFLFHRLALLARTP
jgi:hypothetical protein